MSRRVRDGFATLFCFAVVLGGLVAVDPRVRDKFRGLASETASDGLRPWTDRAADLGHAVMVAARDQSLDQAPLLVFTAVAILLVVSMLRT